MADAEVILYSVPDYKSVHPDAAYRFSRGCTPVSAAMVLGYWDDRGYSDLIDGGGSTYAGSKSTDGYLGLINNELGPDMGYIPGGGTYFPGCYDDIETTCNDTNSYDFRCMYDPSCLWTEFCDEIDAGRPFLWDYGSYAWVQLTDGTWMKSEYHTVAAVGYKYVNYGLFDYNRWYIIHFNSYYVGNPYYLCDSTLHATPRSVTVMPGGGCWSGSLNYNTTWSGNVSIVGTVIVPTATTLTITPTSVVNLNGHAVKISGTGMILRQTGSTFNPDVQLLSGYTLKGQYANLDSASADGASSDHIAICSDITYAGSLDLACAVTIDSSADFTIADNSTITLNGHDIVVNSGTITRGQNYVSFIPDIQLFDGAIRKGQYATLSAAITAAQSGDEIHLASAYSIDTPVSVPANVTLKIETTEAVTLNQKITVLNGAELDVTANAEIIASADLQIDAGGALTIDAGAEFEFASGKELLVGGSIETNGTSFAPVIFTSQSGSWDGIHFEDSGNGSEIEYCEIRDAAIGINLDCSSPEIKHCVFEDCNVGVYGVYTDYELEISDNEISGHDLYGIYLAHGEDPQILRNSITNGAGSNAYGIYLNFITNPTYSIYTLHENEVIGAGKYGIYLIGVDVSIKENYVCNHNRDGIYARSGSWLRMEFSGGGENRIEANGRRGMYLSSSGYALMGSTPNAENCINSNGQHNLYYSGSVLLEAMFNYWGGCPVDPGWFYGNIDYSNALCQCPVSLNAAFSSNSGFDKIPVDPLTTTEDPDSLRLAVMGQAYKLFANREASKALENFDLIITHFPESPEAVTGLRYVDRCYRQQKDKSAAESYFNNILATKSPTSELTQTAKHILADHLVREKSPQLALRYCLEINAQARDAELAADALFDTWLIYLNLLNDRENAQAVLDQFAGTYPKDDRLQLMELLTREIEPTFAIKIDTMLSKPNAESPEPVPAIITEYHLYPNYPNPFNPHTTIGYQLPEAGMVSLKIYNLAGKFVRTLIESPQTAACHQVRWDATDDAGNAVAAGIYLCRMQAGVFRQTQRLVLLK